MNNLKKDEKDTRIISFDYWKGLACFGVVFAHVKVPNYYLDGIIQACFRFVIPLFFMISGYFCYSNDRDNFAKKIPVKVKHISFLCLEGFFIYFILNIFIAVLGNNHGGVEYIIPRLSELFTFKHMVSWILFNSDPLVNILWFLFALLYCYILVLLESKSNLYKFSLYLIPFQILTFLFFSHVCRIAGAEIPTEYYRNAWLFGMPFFKIGMFFKSRKAIILQRGKTSFCLFLLSFGSVLAICEWFWIGRAELYIGSIIQVMSIFVFCIIKPKFGENRMLSIIGEQYSLSVYLSHYAILLCIGHFEGILGDGFLYLFYLYIRVFLVFGLAVGIGITKKMILEKYVNWRKHDRRIYPKKS